LIISGERFSEKMAGIALRQSAIAKTVSKVSDVAIATPYDWRVVGDIEFLKYDKDDQRTLQKLVQRFDIIFFQGHILYQYPFLKKTDKVVIVDIFSPITFESLNWHQYEEFSKRIFFHNLDLVILNDQLEVGDFFICSNEVQRRFWIGMLVALNRVSPYTIDQDEELKRLIAVVPFGIFERGKKKKRNVLKGVHPKIKRDDHLLLWNGGIYNWLDPKTPINAMVDICQTRADVKLVFMGTHHPNPEIPVMPACVDAIRMAEDYGLADRFVFFLDWTEADLRFDYLLESDATLSFYYNNIETRYSYRTRLVDNIATEVPPIVTDCGDSFSKIIKEFELGEILPPGNVDAAVNSIMRIIDDRNLRREYSRNLKKFTQKMYWEFVLSPLMEFLDNPFKSPDYGKGASEYSRIYPKGEYSPAEHKVYPSMIQYLDENDFIADLKDLYVESTSSCNLRCDMCLITAPESRIPVRKRFGQMRFETFKKLDNVFPYISFLSLNGTGEALLHPQLFEMIEHAKRYMREGAKISFNTNGLLLNQESIEKIFATGVDIIIVSIDAPEKELYERIRLNSDFDLVISNIKNLAMEKKRRTTEIPEIGIETVAMKRNLKTIPQMVYLAESIGASILAITNMVAYKSELKDEILYDGVNREEVEAIFQKTKELALKAGIRNVRIPAIDMNVERKCWFYDKAIIKWDGSVMPCCQLVDSYTFFVNDRAVEEKELSFGNINVSSLLDIWNSKEYAEFRYQVKKRNFPPACGECLWNGVI